MDTDKSGLVNNLQTQLHNSLDQREHSHKEVDRLADNKSHLIEPGTKDEEFINKLHHAYMSEQDAENMINTINQTELQLALEFGSQVETHYAGIVKNQVLGVQEKSHKLALKATEYLQVKDDKNKANEEISKEIKDLDLEP